MLELPLVAAQTLRATSLRPISLFRRAFTGLSEPCAGKRLPVQRHAQEVVAPVKQPIVHRPELACMRVMCDEVVYV